MKCSRCQHENRAGAKFCEECASPLARTCGHCGGQLSPTAKFCPECAHPTGLVLLVREAWQSRLCLQPPTDDCENRVSISANTITDPHRVEVVGLQQVASRRHAVLPSRHRIHEPRALIVRKGAEVDGARRILHARAVAGAQCRA